MGNLREIAGINGKKVADKEGAGGGGGGGAKGEGKGGKGGKGKAKAKAKANPAAPPIGGAAAPAPAPRQHWCAAFLTDRGCKHGDSCVFPHVPNDVVQEQKRANKAWKAKAKAKAAAQADTQ